MDQKKWNYWIELVVGLLSNHFLELAIREILKFSSVSARNSDKNKENHAKRWVKMVDL